MNSQIEYDMYYRFSKNKPIWIKNKTKVYLAYSWMDKPVKKLIKIMPY